MPVKCHEKTFNMKRERKTVEMFGPSAGRLSKKQKDKLRRKREAKNKKKREARKEKKQK